MEFVIDQRAWTVPVLKRLVSGFPPRRPGFEPGSSHVGFVVDKVVLGQVFSEYFSFPANLYSPPISPQSPSPIIWGWYNRAEVAAVPRDSVSTH
jgi:hypothetical protein